MGIQITVIGSSGQISTEIQLLAEQVGAEVAKSGAILVTGGRDGVMEAASRGARKFKGTTVGILPEENELGANPYIEIKIPTGIGYARNYINILSSNAIISIAGSGGTLSEIGFAIALQKLLILMQGTGGVTDMIVEHQSLFPNAPIYSAKTSQEAVNLILRKIQE